MILRLFQKATVENESGEKLPTERELAGQFQVSRVAIREALRKLEHAGFMVTRQGATGGAYVTDLTFEYLVNAFLGNGTSSGLLSNLYAKNQDLSPSKTGMP